MTPDKLTNKLHILIGRSPKYQPACAATDTTQIWFELTIKKGNTNKKTGVDQPVSLFAPQRPRQVKPVP